MNISLTIREIEELPLSDVPRNGLCYRMGLAYARLGMTHDEARRRAKPWFENPDTEALRAEVTRLEAKVRESLPGIHT